MTLLAELVLDSTQPSANITMILATLWFIKHYFAKFTTSPITMGQYAIKKENRVYQNDLINEVFKRAMIQPQIKFFIEGEENEIVQEELNDPEEFEDEFMLTIANRHKSIWFLDSFTSYRNFENDLLNPSRHYQRNGFFLLIYTGAERERLSNVKKVFKRLFSLYVTNVNILMVAGKVPYLYTYFPFAKNKCHSSMPEYYLSFRGIEKNFDTFEVNKTLFPSKVINMHGCELVVATWQYPPYIYVDNDPKTGELIRLHGIEGMLITLLSQLMNFKIRIKEPIPRKRGEVYPNGTATGAVKMITDAEANITIISFMYDRQRADVMQPSYSYLAIRYVLAIPQGDKISPFERIAKPFRYILWTFFSSTLLVAIIFIYYIRFLGQSKLMNFVYGQGNLKPLTNLISILFGGPMVTKLPHRNFARYILAVWILYTFVVRSAYSGALFILLQDGRARTTLKNLNEIIDRNYTIYAFPAVGKVLTLTLPHGTIRQINANTPADKVFKRIGSTSDKEKIAFCILEYSVKLYNQKNPSRIVDILDQNILTSPVVFYMPLHSYLELRSQILILRILSAGLMAHYESSYLYSSTKVQHVKREPKKLSFWLLFGLFSVYAALLLFAFVIFLLELGAAKSRCCKCIVDFINF